MRLFVVEGPTGIGKTVVVRALYEQLAMRQARPAYWPATLDALSPPGAGGAVADASGVSRGRGGTSVQPGAVWRQVRARRIYPVELAPALGSRPGYFWWGLTGERQAFAALGGDPQIERHVTSIADAVARGDRLTRDRLVLAAKTASLLASLGLLGPVAAGLAATVGNLQATGEVLRSVRGLARSKAGLMEAALRRNSGSVFSVDARPRAIAGAEDDARLLGLVASVLPLLVAVEDAQFLDPVTIRLLQVLSRQSRAAGLIVLIVDTDEPGDGDAGGLADWLRSEDREQRVTRIRLQPLSAGELTEIAIAELGTGLDAAMLARVVDEAAGVPEILYQLLEAPAVATALREGGPGPTDLAAITDMAGVRTARADAPPSTRRALAVASVHGPMTIRGWLTRPSSPPAGPSAAICPDVTSEAVDAAITSGWLQQRPRTPIIEFTSPHVLRIVRAALDRELTPTSIGAVQRALLAAVVTAHADHTWDDLALDVRESLLDSVIAEDAQAFWGPAHDDLAAELFTLRRATGRDAADAELLEAIARRLAGGQVPAGVLTVATAEALFDAGRQDQALQLLQDEHSRLLQEHGEDDTRALSALRNLAAAYAAAARAVQGQPEAQPLYRTALNLYEELLRLRERLLPADREQVIATRKEYAQLLADCYLYSQALSQGEILLNEQRTVFGADHQDTLLTRRDLAYWQGQAGNQAAAVAGLRLVLPDLVRVFGPDNAMTLITRANLAYWQGRAGSPAAAAAAYQDVVSDMARVLGPDHPETLRTRASLVYWQGRAGNSAAAAAYQDMLPDMVRVLGPDHLDTLIARTYLADWTRQTGNPAAAAAAYQHLLPDMVRVLGPDHLHTLSARAALAGCMGQAGDQAAAVAAYQDVLPDMARVLGSDHPETLIARANVADWRGKADPAVGAADYQDLLPDLVRVLGPDNPDTLGARANLAGCQGQAGELAGAAAAYQDLIPDMVRVLGRDHPSTLVTRASLGDCMGQFGPAAAVAALGDVLPDMVRVLGPDHPDTMIARANLDYWQGQMKLRSE
jgi:hypothetical protein